MLTQSMVKVLLSQMQPKRLRTGEDKERQRIPFQHSTSNLSHFIYKKIKVKRTTPSKFEDLGFARGILRTKTGWKC